MKLVQDSMKGIKEVYEDMKVLQDRYERDKRTQSSLWKI